MGATSFGFSYDWETIESSLDVVTGGAAGQGTATTSAVVGDEGGIPLAAHGGLVESSPISDQWQAVIDTVVTQMTVRDREITDYLGAWLQVCTMVGVLSGTGGAAAPHGVNGAVNRVISVSAWYLAGDGSTAPLIVTSVTPSVVNLTGGPAGATFRAVMIFGTGL